MKTSILSIVLLLSSVYSTFAQQQYPTDRQYSVPFDNQPFFFQPSQVSPYQMGVFSDVIGQFSDHPLSEINRNPANLNQLNERSYLYADFKTLPDETLKSYYSGCVNCITPAWIITPTEENRTIREPFLLAAYFMNPIENSGWRLGLTYQLMSMSESFYQIRSNPYTYYDNQLATGSALPSPSPYDGKRDQYRIQGHFPSFYTGYEFSEDLSIGLKVGYNYYSGNGNHVSENFGNISDIAIPPQANEFSRQRDVIYSHWDFSAGINAGLSDRSTVGVSIGYLTGAFDQKGSEIYNQAYENYDLNGDDFYYTNFSDWFERGGFERNGQTLYATADYTFGRDENSIYRLNYRVSFSDQDFDFGSSGYRFSESENYFENNEGELQFWISENEQSTLNSGAGSSELWQHRFSASYSRKLSNNFQLKSGFQINFDLDKESYTDLQQRLNSNYTYREEDGEPTNDQLYSSDNRTLNITQPANYRFTGQLPIIFGRSFGQHIYAELGVMGYYRSEIRKVNQVVEYDNRYEVIENGEVEIGVNQNQYVDELRRHHSSTMLNAFSSITFLPNDQLRIRLMTYSDRREINRISSVDAIRFQISAEIGF
ncbi:hypothetical protein [Rhodohalobacter halophilus]|uniref:hypothetical protein n=1 Tax=Rhodohalobacter halophilus TaxID=1812810 RepID=UPI00083FCE45|nr:hypothetical protein [Rhodohalobacter halophilus]